MKKLDVLAAILLVIGGLNWFLVGVFDFNLVKFIFHGVMILQRITYIVVGLAALYQIFQYKAIRKRWND